ncbi:flotillin family protein [Acetobacterium malicum]|uniref:flotillin family protein n=1 Tax=Acetobacterium malicum TaxID=52692 RepID=UPI00359398FE
MSIFTLIIPIVVVLFIISLLMMSYVKAPPDTAYVISGIKRRVIIGKAGIKIPFLERVDKLDLKMMSVDVKTGESVPTNNFIDVMVDGAVKIKIGSSPEAILLASENFLNQSTDAIIPQVKDVLEGNVREIIGSLDLKDMLTDRKSFSEKVQENAVPDLKRMGLEIISFNIQSIRDQAGVIEDLGTENKSQIKKGAAIARANAEKEVAIAESEAAKIANDARIKADLEIAQKNTDLDIRKAELKRQSDLTKAQADAAYQIEQEEQRKTIETKTQEANIIKQVKEIELAAKEVEVREQRLKAEINKTADAERYQRNQKAEADLFEKQKEAEAKLFIAAKDAEANRLAAEADRYAKEQEAAAIEARGFAEAAAIRAKGLAEAAGIDAKAEAMKKYSDAAIMEMYFDALPEVARNVAAPLNNVDRITMYGDGNSAKMVKDIVNTMSQVTEGISESTGINLQSLISGFLGGKMATPTEAPTITVSTTTAAVDSEPFNPDLTTAFTDPIQPTPSETSTEDPEIEV